MLTVSLEAHGLRMHVGQFPPHDGAKQAGFKNGDIIVSFDGRTDLKRETELLEYALNDLKPGSSVPVVILRDGQKMTLSLKINK